MGGSEYAAAGDLRNECVLDSQVKGCACVVFFGLRSVWRGSGGWSLREMLFFWIMAWVVENKSNVALVGGHVEIPP